MMTASLGAVALTTPQNVKECIWIIQVPAGNATNPNIIKPNLTLTGNTSKWVVILNA